MVKTIFFILVFSFFYRPVLAESGRYISNKVDWDMSSSKKFKGYMKLEMNGDNSFSEMTLGQLSLFHIGFTCKEKYFHEIEKDSQIKNNDNKVITIFRCLDAQRDNKSINHHEDLKSACPTDLESRDAGEQIDEYAKEINKLCRTYFKRYN